MSDRKKKKPQKAPAEGLRVPLPGKPPKVEEPRKGKTSYRRRAKHPKGQEPSS